ncbi:hypothetical protein C8C83_2448 [Flavobacterium sp. 90]|uniref:hypothetical protein n=1 Tax=unclassified Flavobacterium TaxID=196869 RepID=UPI000EB07F35|nr:MULTISPECIES: hypothetical protein [unclassified Flavobacterium]RKR10761.1 hypothetical protein C8C82_2754 [Flavobacterium sp. 81]TCK54544.1 hypothetical protein C8C83_2448 [Flavobacterium sp. 90]
MELNNLKLDFYSDFVGEFEIRLYCNAKTTEFKLNISENESGGYTQISLKQGENGIYYFSLWDGYFDQLMHILYNNATSSELPKFILDYEIGEGWVWDVSNELITETELNWVLVQIKTSIMNNTEKYKNEFRSFDCISNLYLFLKFVKENNLQLHITKE